MPIAGDAQPADPLVGRTVAGGRYTVAGVLGRGGMGVVYAAIQHPVNRKVALKLIHRELAGERQISRSRSCRR